MTKRPPSLHLVLVSLCVLSSPCFCFPPNPAFHRPSSALFESWEDNFRNMLESSWNAETMGKVPNSPQVAAEEATNAILDARSDGLGNMCFVDVLLPQYDIAQGPNYYDEIEAVEFCTRLARCLNTQSVIYVNNDKSANRVRRIIKRREEERQGEAADTSEPRYVYEEVEVEDDEREEKDNDEDEHDDEDNLGDNVTLESGNATEFYDDFSDFGGESSAFFSLDADETAANADDSASAPTREDNENTVASEDSIDSLRQQLSSSWGGSPSTTENAAFKLKETKKRTKIVRRRVSSSSDVPTADNKTYRIASFFGNQEISEGGDMSRDVVRAVKAHGLPLDDEETMIILSATSEAEMLAVRALVSKYKESKKIIFVNCRLDPLPLELEDCHTVYHMTPMVATTTIDDRNLFSKVSTKERPPIKVVSIRRYPSDWEIYIDADGNGFELAQKAPAAEFAKQGPNPGWIGGAIKNFMESRPQ